jgi:hypothetical protein
MKKAGEILKEMGFRSEAPDSLKEAFVRHLIKAATGVEVAPGPNERMQLASKGKHISSQQLSFDFSAEIDLIESDETKAPAAQKKSS